MSLQPKIVFIHEESKALHARLERLVKGRKIRVAGDWNGQPWGRSKPSKRGKEYVVRGAGLDVQWGVFLWLEGERLSIRADEVEWL